MYYFIFKVKYAKLCRINFTNFITTIINFLSFLFSILKTSNTSLKHDPIILSRKQRRKKRRTNRRVLEKNLIL